MPMPMHRCVRLMSASRVSVASPHRRLFQALEALIQEPCGCFEQTSATTYPLVMALQYFQVPLSFSFSLSPHLFLSLSASGCD